MAESRKQDVGIMGCLYPPKVISKALLFTSILAAGGLSACAFFGRENDDAEKVIWEGRAAYRKTVATFNIKPDQALRLVVEEIKTNGARDRRHGGVRGQADFIVGRWYWFGIATKIEAYAEGYYVNGDTGQIEFRESDKVIKSSTRRLSKDTWTKITPLPVTETNK